MDEAECMGELAGESVRFEVIIELLKSVEKKAQWIMGGMGALQVLAIVNTRRVNKDQTSSGR